MARRRTDFQIVEMKTGIISIQTLLNRACRNHYLHTHCTLIVMIPEMMSRAIFYKNHFK